MSTYDRTSYFNEKDDPGLIEYLKTHNIDNLKDYIITKINENGLENVNLVTIAKINNDTAGLVKELVISNQIDNTELSNQIAKEIIADIETKIDNHLKKYSKFTLNSPSIVSSDEESTAQFFNLISLLKDVSVLGRRLLEMAPHFNAQKPTATSGVPVSPSSSETRSINSGKSKFGKILKDEDATSEDLLAALIESSSSDDFLVLSSSLDSITTKDMILAAMIYIKSHECFTLSHDIQGVVMVLRRAKFIIMHILAPKNQVELITKLLTSISRYSEMNYVFDLFRDRNQFEVLLSKGVEKTPELRIALFNYVKKNPEFYALVTLNFSMFREIAESLEASAIKRLNKITSVKNLRKKSGHKDENLAAVSGINVNESDCSALKTLYSKESLNLSLVELVDASDCYAKAGCYKKSNYCERKAKLVALQLALLPTGTNVLEVAQSRLTDLISSFEIFTEAYIVANAYDCHLAWRQALFRNVILNGNSSYLDKFCDKCDLSSALVEELVLLYKQYINGNQLNSEEMFELAKAMQTLLVKLSDVELKIKLYSQLSFDDAKEELLRDEAVQAHLKDLKLA